MRVEHLTLHDFRNYTDLTLIPGTGINIFIGKNAQGKTSVLEAIYMLATSRSWRAGKDSELIRWDAERALVNAEVSREEQNDVEVKIVLSTSEKKHISINTIRHTKVADFIGQVKVVLIEPYDVDIIRGDPGTRRKFMNLEISQIQPQYCHLLVSYKKVLEQRNRYLKELCRMRPKDGLLSVLDEQLVQYGSMIIERRMNFVRQIDKMSGVLHAQITEDAELLRVEYASRLNLAPEDTALENIADKFRARLEELRAAEIYRGVTLVGPQRDDLKFTVNNVDARVYGSQGQQRTIALSLRLAELDVMEDSAGEPPIVLLDDVMTDLDEDRRAHVFQMTQGRCQTFITAATRRAFETPFLESAKIFNVSGGTLCQE